MTPHLLLLASALAVQIERIGSAPIAPALTGDNPVVDTDGVLWLGQDEGTVGYDPTSGHWTWTRPSDGAPEGAVSAMARDGAGDLWVGTLDGAVGRHDAQGWQTWKAEDAAPLAIRALHPLTGAGVLLEVQAPTPLYALEDQIWEPLFQGPRPRALLSMPSGEIRISDEQGVSSIDLASHETTSAWAPEGIVRDLARSERGTWMSTHDGLYLHPPDAPEGIRVLDHTVERLAIGEVTWAAGGRALWRVDGDGPQQLQLPAELQGASIAQLALHDDGAVWISTRKGVGRYHQDAWTVRSHTTGIPASPTLVLSDRHVWALSPGWLRRLDSTGGLEESIDHGKNVAAGPHTVDDFLVHGQVAFLHTRRGHLLRYDLRTRRLELLSMEADHPVVDGRGRPWIVRDGEVWRRDGARWVPVSLPAVDLEPHSTPDSHIADHVRIEDLALHGTTAGTILVARSGGLLRWDGANWEDLGSPWKQEHGTTAVEDGPDGTLWLGTQEGLLAWDGTWTPTICPADGAVTALHTDARGDLWVGTSGGLAVHRGSGGWANAAVLTGTSVQDIVPRGDGTVVVRTTNGHLPSLDPDTLSLADAGLPEVEFLYVDDSGREWMAAGQSTWWEDGNRKRHVTRPTSEANPGGGSLAWNGSPVHLADNAAAWFQDGRWQGYLDRPEPPVALVQGDEAWQLLLASGELLTGDVHGQLSWSDPPLNRGSALVRWQGRLCAAGDALACQDPAGVWIPLDVPSPIHALAATDRQLLVGGDRNACRIDPRRGTRCVEIPSTVRAILPDGRGGAWLGTDQGVLRLSSRWKRIPTTQLLTAGITDLARSADGQLWASTDDGALHQRTAEGWQQVQLFDAPIRAMIATDTGLMLRAGDEIFEVIP